MSTGQRVYTSTKPFYFPELSFRTVKVVVSSKVIRYISGWAKSSDMTVKINTSIIFVNVQTTLESPFPGDDNLWYHDMIDCNNKPGLG